MGLSNSKSKVTQRDKQLLSLKSQRDKLKIHLLKLAKTSDTLTALAKESLLKNKQNKSPALIILSKRKNVVNFIDKTEGQLANIGELICLSVHSQVTNFA